MSTKNQIIEELFNGKDFNDCLGKMEPAHLRDDLRQEVILTMCELPEEKVVKLHEEKVLVFYVVRVIINMIRSTNSPFAKKYRTTYTELVEQEEPTGPDMNERLLREELEDYTLSEINSLYWYDAELIRLYMNLGTFRAIQEMTGIPYVSCFKTIKKAMGVLKRRAMTAPHERPVPIFSREELNQIKK